MNFVYPVVLSGGVGSRLWPLSRSLYPKQLLSLYSDQSLIQDTVMRLQKSSYKAPTIICNQEHRFVIAEQMRDIGVSPLSIVLEPEGKNTAPAAAVAALLLYDADPDALMLVLPADHIIQKPGLLDEAVNKASKLAKNGTLLTFGINPDKPETGYGYILQGAPMQEFSDCFKAEKFLEKPDLQTAKEFLLDDRYLWNSGIFLFSARSYLEALEKNKPQMMELCRLSVKNAVEDLDFCRLDAAFFKEIEADSIDFAVMEHEENLAVIPVDLGWSDIGSWSALWDIGSKDTEGNVVNGDVFIENVSDSYIHSQKPFVSVIGLTNIIVVATDDAVLVIDKERSQEVKSVIDNLKAKGRTEQDEHTKVYRPWGWYQIVSSEPRFKVKQLSIKSGAKLSLQKHAHRTEHWVVVKGDARVTQADKTFMLSTNESTYIPLNVKHSLENVTDNELRIVEVQTGTYLGEDDIERFEDIYGRSN